MTSTLHNSMKQNIIPMMVTTYSTTYQVATYMKNGPIKMHCPSTGIQNELKLTINEADDVCSQLFSLVLL